MNVRLSILASNDNICVISDFLPHSLWEINGGRWSSVYASICVSHKHSLFTGFAIATKWISSPWQQQQKQHTVWKLVSYKTLYVFQCLNSWMIVTGLSMKILSYKIRILVAGDAHSKIVLLKSRHYQAIVEKLVNNYLLKSSLAVVEK